MPITSQEFDKEVRQMSEVEKAWLAAAIDGEGTIGISLTSALNTAVAMGNTSREFLENARRITDSGIIQQSNLILKQHKPFYTWFLRQREQLGVLQQIVPYLIIKKHIAEAVIKFLLVRCNSSEDHTKGELSLALQVIETIGIDHFNDYHVWKKRLEKFPEKRMITTYR